MPPSLTGASPKGLAVKIILGIGIPILVALVWGALLAPNSSVPLPAMLRLLFKTLIFGAATAALFAAGRGMLGITYAAGTAAAHALSALLGDPLSE